MLNNKQDLETSISKLLKGLSLDIHITGRCNYDCQYCFAHYNGVEEITQAEWINILDKFHDTGIRKITFSGGEPLAYKGLGFLLKYSHNLGFITSIVTNGRLLSEAWLRGNMNYLNIIGISINLENIEPVKTAINNIIKVSKEVNHHIYLKLNYVVTKKSIKQNPASLLAEFNPDRIKFFQFCEIKGENDHVARDLAVGNEEFNEYVCKVRSFLQGKKTTVVAETADIMNFSYLILDPAARFCDKRGGKNRFSRSLTEVSVKEALSDIYSITDLRQLIENMNRRGGLYSVKSNV